MKTSESGISFIKKEEGFRSKMYADSKGYPTIGYGTFIDTEAEQYLRTATLTTAQADALLRRDLAGFEASINRYVTVPLNQNQFDALASFVYNVGPGNFQRSTLLKRINERATAKEITAAFLMWLNKARRQREANLYHTQSLMPVNSGGLLAVATLAGIALYSLTQTK